MTLHASDIVALRTQLFTGIDGSGAFNKVDPISSCLIENSSDCVALLDLKGRAIYLSEAGQSAMGLDDFDTLYGRLWGDLWHADLRPFIAEVVGKARGGVALNFCAAGETANGELRVWDVVVSPVYNQIMPDEFEEDQVLKGRRDIVRLICVSRDVTHEWLNGAKPHTKIPACLKKQAKAAQKNLN